ncbi:HNH endonuclease [Corynebacterium sp. B5-R-101]|uniref:HNH endonuclease n=1 Tax=Corynebacterium intestinale TaxID=2943492 RepID=A0ABT0T9Z2_9CORY|nr:HNH endonuclease signature motif containing protein [Corynebacterium intestinale]MCL8493891.1 HNH endonuclease [Corynebacterium intestinale]MCP1390127.1 HNH endonuclease [Corynebacterium intestinale]
MGDLETYFSYRSSGLDLVGLAVGSVDDLRARGASLADAVELAGLHRVYFGSTRFTGKQRQARAAAVAQGHDVATLSLIESYTAKVKKELDAWNLRVRLAGTPAHQIPKVAKERLKQLRPQRVPEPGVRLTYRKVGPHSLTITDSALRISEMRGTLESINPTDLLDAAGQVFFNQAHGGSKPAVATNVVVTLDELDQIVRGEGDDIELVLTNGGRMTGREFVSYKFAEVGYVTLVHPTIGPVWLHRVRRLAGFEQRIMASAEHPTCAREGCNKPADYCQVHHLVPWQAGGATDPPNLTMLCAYHNGINDDDPDKPTGAGYVFRLRGGVGYVPPWAEPITSQPAYQAAQAALKQQTTGDFLGSALPDT